MPTKKITKKMVKKPVVKKSAVKPMPVMEHKCECGENCNCHCHGRAHLLKHIMVWAIIFALGLVCGKLLGCNHGMKHMPKLNPVFENGCLKMDSVNCPKMLEKLANADVDGNGCVSLEEYKAIKKDMKKEMRKGFHGFHKNKGPRGPQPMPQPEMAE